MNTFIDLETIPQQPELHVKAAVAETIQAPAQMKKQETIDEWHNGGGKYAGVKAAAIEEAYRKTSFDGSKGQICSIAWAVGDSTVFASSDEDITEAGLLREFFDNLTSALKDRPPYFIGHYIGGFDLKFLYQRAVINNVNPGMDLGQWGRHSSQYFDTMTAWAGYGGSISLDNLCKALGIEGKPDDIDGSKVWDYYKAGRIEEIRQYNISDIEMVRQVFNRLSFN